MIAAVLLAAGLQQAAVLPVYEVSDNLIVDQEEAASETEAVRRSVEAARRYRLAPTGAVDEEWAECVAAEPIRGCARSVGRTLAVRAVITTSIRRWPGGTWFVLRRFDVRSGRFDELVTEHAAALESRALGDRLTILAGRLAVAPARPVRADRALEANQFRTEINGDAAQDLMAALKEAGLPHRRLRGVSCERRHPLPGYKGPFDVCGGVKEEGAARRLAGALDRAGAVRTDSVTAEDWSLKDLRCDEVHARCSFVGY